MQTDARQICYLHVIFKDTPHGSLIKVAFSTNQVLLNMINTIGAQYQSQGQSVDIEVLSEKDGDHMIKTACLTYPLWQDLVATNQIIPLVFAN